MNTKADKWRPCECGHAIESHGADGDCQHFGGCHGMTRCQCQQFKEVPDLEEARLREAFFVAARNYARCHWGTCVDLCHTEHDDEVDDEIHAENEDHYQDRMRDAWHELDSYNPRPRAARREG